MKGTMRRIVSILLAVALVITSLQYTPKTVSAAEDYSTLTFTNVTAATGDVTYAYSIVSNTLVGFAAPEFLDNGITMQMAFSADNLAENTIVKINDVETAAGSVVTYIGSGLVKINPSLFDNNAYTKVQVTSTTGETTYIIRKGLTSEEQETEFVDGIELLQDSDLDAADHDAWDEVDGSNYNGDGTVTFIVPEKNDGDNWSTQFRQTKITLTEGKWYVASVTITSDVARNFQLLIQSDGQDGGDWSVINTADNNGVFLVQAGVPYTYTVKFQANGIANNYLYGIMMGYIGAPSAAANVTISNVSLKGYDNEPAIEPEETTTPQPNYDRDAFANIEAESWDIAGGGVADGDEGLSNGGNLGGVTNGVMPGYNVYFSEPAGAVEFFYTSPAGAGGNVEVYVDDTTGTPAAIITLEETAEGSDWSVGNYKIISADINVSAGNHTIYTKYVATDGAYFIANVDYFKFIKASENLTWLTNDSLTASVGTGTKYAEIGSVPDGELQIQDTQLWWISGASAATAKFTFNGTVMQDNTGNSALGVAIPYSSLVTGINTIVVEETDSEGNKYTYLFYIDVPVKPLNIVVNNYASYTGKYIVKFDSVEDATSYKVYIDGMDAGITLGGSGDYITYDEFATYATGDHTLQVSAVYEDGTESATSVAITINKPENAGTNNDIAQIYVQTDDTSIQALNITKEMDDLQSSITVIDQNGEYEDIYEDVKKTTIKVRGNSTAVAEKKAFNIKFNTKRDLFGLTDGLGKTKKWSLLANAFDKSAIRNKLAMELGIDMGVPYNSKSRYVDLYLNGRYMGNYLLIESVEAGESRVDIDSENTETYNNDVLLELENSKRFEEDGVNFQTSLYGQYFIFNSPETVEDSTQEFIDQKLANTQALLNKFETDLSESDYEGFSQYIDVDSFVNYYLVCEIFKYQDIAFSSTRFFVKDDVLYAGPMWDLDLSSGNVSIGYYGELDQGYTGYKATAMKWFEMLMANNTFAKKVKERFEEMLPTIKAIYEGEGNLLDSVVSEIEGSVTRNYTAYDQGGAGWSISQKDAGDYYSYSNTYSFESWDESVDQFRTWITNRVTYLESQWIGLDGFTYTKDSLDGVLSDTTDEGLNNYVRYENVSASATSGDASQAIDNNAGTRWESTHGVDPQDYIVDLGAQYSLKEFMIRWEGANAKDFTIEVSTDGVNYQTVAIVSDAASEGNRLDIITLDEATTARFVKVHGTARNLDYGYSIWELGIYGPDPQKEYEGEIETETETTTTTEPVESIDPVAEPADADWIEVQGSNGEYYYYIPTEATNYFASIENRMENIYFGYKEIAAPFDTVTLNGVAITKSDGGFVEVQKEIMEPGAYQLQITDYYGNQTVSFWIKKNKISNYTPTGLATSILDGILTVNWVTSTDADTDGCLYTVTVAGEATNVTDLASVKSATYDFAGKEYGNYEVVLTTKTTDGTVVNTQTVTVRYKDPEAVDSTVTYRARWEAKRYLIANWTTVENATGYAVYVDGKLYDTTTDLTYTIPAYAFANNLNEFNQPTTVGKHSVSIVALFDGAEALENEADVNSKHVMDTYTADILVNYMYGNLTNIWNVTGIDSVWNFTVSEIPKTDITEGADVKVEYNDDGSADVNIIYTGRHSTYVDQDNVGDQAWTIKAAIYDQPITAGELLNLSFDITGPAYLVGQRIQIKCVPEEVDDNEQYYSVPEYGYEEALYTFEPVYAEDGETVEYAVLHYTNSFETTNDTYDLLFGLGLLYGAEEGGSIDINLSDPSVKKVYGVTSVSATGIPNGDDTTNNSGYISWTTNVPTHLSSEYTYDLVIKDKDGKIVSVKDAEGNVLSTLDGNGNVLVSVPNATNNSTYYGLAEGTYTVEVSSIYDNSITATKSTTMVIKIPETDHPDLIITDISIPEGEYRVGDTVPVSITMTNIGTAEATPAEGNLAVHLHVKSATTGEKGWYTVDGNTIPAGGSVTKTINYTITADDSDGNDLFTIIAEADSDAHVVESDETNNVHSVVYRFLQQLQEVTLTNNGTDISATWPDAGEGTKYIIEYEVNGETKQVEVDTNSYVFPTEDAMANNTEVKVYIASDDGSSALYAEGVAQADIIIETIVPENGFAYVGQENNLFATVKNIGTASATAGVGQEQNVAVAFTSTDVFTGYGSYYEVLAPNETAIVTIPGYTPTVEGTVTLDAVADDINRIPESNEDNNTATVDVYAVEEGAVELSLDDTESDNPFVKVSWKNPEGVTADEDSKYMIKYVVDGVEITDYVQNPEGYTEENQIVFVETDADGNTRYYIKNYEKLDNQSEVYVYVVTDNGEIPCGVDTAMVDLVISAITVVSESKEANTAYLDDEFSIVLSVKNQGTAKVAESSDEVLEDGTIVDYGKWIINQMTLQNNITVPGDGLVSTNTGLAAGEIKEFRYDGVVASAVGTYNIPFKTDSPGWEAVNVVGFIPESNEDNNTATLELEVTDPPFVQEKMDWTLFTAKQGEEDNFDENGNPIVVIANGSDRKPVEYKILDTSITDKHYIDMLPAVNVEAYGGQYIAIKFVTNETIVQPNDDIKASKLYFAQVSSQTVENYDYATTDSTIEYGDVRKPLDGVLQSWDGNGYQLHTRSFAAGKYYIVKVVNEDGSYIVVGLRIPGDLGNWIKAKASDNSDPDKVPVVYHDKDHTVNGTVYYDGSDLGLSNLAIYNGNHLAITTDGTRPLNSGNWKMEIAYASVDENGKFVEKIADDLLEEIGYDPGTITLLPTDEIFGEQGANTILVKMPELMWDLPIHSPLGGQRDSEYYILKVYNDTVNAPDEYIYIPLNIMGDIPMIEGVNGLTVAGRGDTLSVMWTNSATQEADGYLYDVYIDKNHDGDYDDDGELVSTDVVAGAYNYTDGIDVANSSEYSVKVVAKWCQQESPAEAEYVVGGDQEKETLPGEDVTPPADDNEHEWVLISGENVLPVTNGTSEEGGTTNAQIWYYTDDDMYSVVGYNGYYISLNGSTTYFTGDDSMLFVQDEYEDGTDTLFESKIIHDKFYDGQILINAANMFTTFEDTDGDGVLYYTVKVTGENGNTEKNFYFKVVLDYEDETIKDAGEWRLISGQYKLPVMFGEYTLEGTVEYYDHVSLTNTYDMTGYNGYFISVVGDTEYYSARTTQLYVSGPSETEILGTEGDSTTFTAVAGEQTYTEKEIYDKVYRGQIQMRCSTTFEVAYTTTYYLLKIVGTSATDGSETVTYVPVRITVSTGDVEVQGFQMNTDNSEGGIAQYNPSFRVVSRASNIMTIGNKLYEVKAYGTVYALDSDVSKNKYAEMKLDSDNDKVYNFEATKDVGTLSEWTTADGAEKYHKYYALSFEYTYYTYESLSAEMAFRAYAVIDDGTEDGLVVYGNKIYSVSMYEIADNLYSNKKMGTIAAHQFLYDNVLNIVDIGTNRLNIARALMAATDVINANSENYALVNQTYKDMWDYIYCRNNYTYSGRTEFKCSTEENEDALLALLNGDSDKYSSVAHWIRENVEAGKGFHEVVEYSWDNSIDKEFDSE